MSRSEALHVLGLESGATEEQIRAAHRRLIMQIHPDKGGSTYLRIGAMDAVFLNKSGRRPRTRCRRRSGDGSHDALPRLSVGYGVLRPWVGLQDLCPAATGSSSRPTAVSQSSECQQRLKIDPFAAGEN